MKIRYDYVTNSSSSSFIISKRDLSPRQIDMIKNHWNIGRQHNLINEKWDYAWSIDENEEYITGYVFMDNFQISSIFNLAGIAPNNVYWDEFAFDLDNKEELKEIEHYLSRKKEPDLD